MIIKELNQNTEDFGSVKYRVVQLLRRYPQTRNSDKLLLEKYYRVYEKKDIKLTAVKTNFKTILRSRQFIQSHNPDLRASEEVQQVKKNNEEVYREEFS